VEVFENRMIGYIYQGLYLGIKREIHESVYRIPFWYWRIQKILINLMFILIKTTLTKQWWRRQTKPKPSAWV
jgi:hypothetical protein